MRQLSAILLISIFAFSQYARQLSYLECEFSNLFKTAAVQCDCATQAGFDQPDQAPLPLSNNHLHIHLDEFFFGAGSIVPTYWPGINLSTEPFLPDDNVSNGHPSPPWQPPNGHIIYNC